MNNTILKEQRCECGKLLLKGIFFHATLEIKCKKCGKLSQIGSIKEVENEHCYLLVADGRGFITNASEAACSILEYSYDELVGKHFSEIDKHMSREIADKLMPPNSILTEDHPFQIDTYNQTKSGRKLPVSVFLKLYKPTDTESYVLISASVKDDLDKENLVEEVKFKECACDFYFDIDLQGEAKFISPSVEALFGISPAYGLGKNYFDFVPEEYRAKTKEIFEYFSAQAQPYRILGHVGADINGKRTDSELFFTPNLNSDGKFIGYRVLGWLKE